MLVDRRGSRVRIPPFLPGDTWELETGQLFAQLHPFPCETHKVDQAKHPRERRWTCLSLGHRFLRAQRGTRNQLK